MDAEVQLDWVFDDGIDDICAARVGEQYPGNRPPGRFLRSVANGEGDGEGLMGSKDTRWSCRIVMVYSVYSKWRQARKKI